MYFCGINAYFIILARLVAGVGLGVIGCCFGEIAQTTTVKERSSILSRIMVGRQIGLVIGPVFNFLLYKLDFSIGPLVVDKFSSPGLLMCVSWIIVQILVILFYKNLKEFQHIRVDDRVQDDENAILTADNSGPSYSTVTKCDVSMEQIDFVEKSYFREFRNRLYNEYIRKEVIAILFGTFCVFVMLTTIDTFVIPFTQEYYGWSEIEISLYFAVAGFGIVLFFMIHSFASKWISDKFFFLIGMIINLIMLLILLSYLLVTKNDTTILFKNRKIDFKDYLVFISSTMCATVFSLPLIVVSSISLLSKITSKHNQGLTQGIRRSCVDIACILGPIWTGTFYKHWLFLFGPLSVIFAITIVMLIISFKQLKETE
jgi:ceroid-lipofuscinosis MFS transporter 7